MNIAQLLLFSAMVTCVMNASDGNPIPVEVWRGGDDGLTLTLADAFENAFTASPYFILSSGRKKGTLVVRIPTHVGWRQIGKRTRVLTKWYLHQLTIKTSAVVPDRVERMQSPNAQPKS
jgi:hypothetical protein